MSRNNINFSNLYYIFIIIFQPFLKFYRFKFKTKGRMKLYKLQLVGLALILFMTGCKDKDELTLPVRVHFKIGISQDALLKSEYLDFAECQIGIKSIRFEGKREAGTDIFFETDSKVNFQTLSFLQPIVISVFDIPQGIYNYMKWDINMKCIRTDGLIDDHFEYTPCIGIVISGSYESLDGTVIPLVFAIDQPEQFNIRANDPYGDSKIVLYVNKEYEATVLFAPDYAFHAISRESLEEAEISGDIGHRKIIISSSQNENLYEILLYRIFQSARVVVK